MSIAVTPLFKRVFCMLGLMPMTLALFASVSADTMTIGLIFLLIACLLRAAYGPEPMVSWRLLGPIYVLLALLPLCKTVYIALPSLLLLTSAERFGSQSRRWVAVVFGCLLTMAVGAAWSNTMLAYWPDPSSLDGGLMSRSSQASVVWTNPYHFLSICRETIDQQWLAWRMMLVGAFGWLTAFLHPILVDAYLFGLVLVAMIEADDQIKISRVQRLLIAAVIVLTVGLMLVSMHLWWNSGGNLLIQGIQGRYFIPIMPLALLLLYNHRLELRGGRSQLDLACGLGSLAITAGAAYSIMMRFYT